MVVHTHTQSYKHTHTSIYIHTHTHTHTHTGTVVSVQPPRCMGSQTKTSIIINITKPQNNFETCFDVFQTESCDPHACPSALQRVTVTHRILSALVSSPPVPGAGPRLLIQLSPGRRASRVRTPARLRRGRSCLQGNPTKRRDPQHRLALSNTA